MSIPSKKFSLQIYTDLGEWARGGVLGIEKKSEIRLKSENSDP